MPPGPMPAAVAANILAVEFLVHGWDLAQATGQATPVSEALAGYVLGLAHDLVTPSLRDGDTFAAEVPAPPGTTALEQLVAFTGRVPMPVNTGS